MNLPSILIDYDKVMDILEFHLGGVIDDELYEKVQSDIDDLPWFDGIEIEENIFDMARHENEVSE